MIDNDNANWHAVARVDKFEGPDADARAKAHADLIVKHGLAKAVELSTIDATVEEAGNLVTTAGWQRVTNLITGAGGQAFNATHARIGVGDSNTAANVADTDLGAAAGSTHRQFALVNGTPGAANGVMTFVAVQQTTYANFHWQEWGVDAGTADGTTVTAPLLNHKITDLGTKTSAAAWTFTVTITLT